MVPMALQLRSRRKSLPTPSLVRFFSEKPDPDVESPQPSFSPGDTDSKPQSSTPRSSISSYLSDVKARLKRDQEQRQQQQQQHNRPTFSSSFPASNAPTRHPSRAAHHEEIQKNLSEFRRRYVGPDPVDSNARPVTFQELYERNVVARSGEADSGSLESAPAKPGGKLAWDTLRQSLKQMGSSRSTRSDALPRGGDALSMSRFRDSLKMRPGVGDSGSGSLGIGGGDNSRLSAFGREIMERKEGEGKRSDGRSKTESFRTYSYLDLGGRLKKLRPESAAKGRDVKGWFSLEELNERLAKLREIEEEESESWIGGAPFRDIRESLQTLQRSDDEKFKKMSLQRLTAIGQLGGTPDFMLQPPKEHLIEKYFHPDNMSSAEKLKIQLAAVRDEFKMSESDCGSARVQVAQLTTKIKHLAKALHKKDKHSRKGLEAMVQRRKRLLRYLRRTDWDSYCLVLSKLGLRDNPDYKNA